MKTLLLTSALFASLLTCMAQEKQSAPDAESAAAQGASQDVESLAKRVQDQEAAVEQARMRLLDIMKRDCITSFPPAPSPAPLSATLEALHVQAEPAQQAEFDRWLDHSLTVCTEDAAFRQTYISLLQLSADLAKLKAGGLGERHPKIVGLENSLESQRKQLSALAAQRRDRLRKELIDGVKASETSPPVSAPSDDYRKAKREYEAELERLKSLQAEVTKEEPRRRSRQEKTAP